MDCQLEILPQAGRKLSLRERAAMRVGKFVHYVGLTVKKLIRDPMLLVRKLQRVSGVRKEDVAPRPTSAVSPSPPLRPGDRVRVRSSEEIRATLDEHGRFEGLGYMRQVMDPFCGRTLRVKKPVRLFFDERLQKLCKLRRVVILEGVYCEPPREIKADWGGCDRACFLFWKEAWLERVSESE